MEQTLRQKHKICVTLTERSFWSFPSVLVVSVVAIVKINRWYLCTIPMSLMVAMEAGALMSNKTMLRAQPSSQRAMRSNNDN